MGLTPFTTRVQKPPGKANKVQVLGIRYSVLLEIPAYRQQPLAAPRIRFRSSRASRIPHPASRTPRTHEQLNRPRGSGFVQFFVTPFSVITTVAVAEPS